MENGHAMIASCSPHNILRLDIDVEKSFLVARLIDFQVPQGLPTEDFLFHLFASLVLLQLHREIQNQTIIFHHFYQELVGKQKAGKPLTAVTNFKQS
ncbi:MAG: hypothetical protein UU10_C0045G0006 [Parcubacteria group bacterium GW2011_GWF1_40_6]|nr:MAG: hypothetical protein UU10_C0045G0006 [Parcubacteria group bacterium GW2011_GWF1_40_6]